MLGHLHSGQVFLVMHDQLIRKSGLLKLMEMYKFTTIGVSAVVDVSSIKRARYCVQVVLCALFLKLQDASNDISLNPSDWLKEMACCNDMCFILNLLRQFLITHLALCTCIS